MRLGRAAYGLSVLHPYLDTNTGKILCASETETGARQDG